MKRYVVSGDSGGRGGMHFLRWVDGGAGGGVQPAQQPAQASQKVLELLSRDFSKPPTDHVQFLVDGSTLTLVGVDAWGNVRTYAFDPQDPQSLRGKRLIAKGAIWTGVISLLLRASTYDAAPALSECRKQCFVQGKYGGYFRFRSPPLHSF